MDEHFANIRRWYQKISGLRLMDVMDVADLKGR
jgi:hypothetical protein